VTLNVAAFWINWKNTQTSYRSIAPTCTRRISARDQQGRGTRNRGEAHPYATVSFNGSYNHSSAASDSATSMRRQYHLAYAPRFIGSITGDYRVPLGMNSLDFDVNYSYKTSFNNSFNQSASSFAQIPSTKMLNGAVAYEVGHLEVSVFGNNLTNARNIETSRRYHRVPGAGQRPGLRSSAHHWIAAEGVILGVHGYIRAIESIA